MKREKCPGVAIHFEVGYFLHFTLVCGQAGGCGCRGIQIQTPNQAGFEKVERNNKEPRRDELFLQVAFEKSFI